MTSERQPDKFRCKYFEKILAYFHFIKNKSTLKHLDQDGRHLIGPYTLKLVVRIQHVPRHQASHVVQRLLHKLLQHRCQP
jgi:hypothetical protein